MQSINKMVTAAIAAIATSAIRAKWMVVMAATPSGIRLPAGAAVVSFIASPYCPNAPIASPIDSPSSRFP